MYKMVSRKLHKLEINVVHLGSPGAAGRQAVCYVAMCGAREGGALVATVNDNIPAAFNKKTQKNFRESGMGGR